MRSNPSAGGSVVPERVADEMLQIAEIVRPKLVADGMFLVGLDIVGDKLMEVNGCSPGGLGIAEKLYEAPVANAVIEEIDRKVGVRKHYCAGLTNKNLATL